VSSVFAIRLAAGISISICVSCTSVPLRADSADLPDLSDRQSQSELMNYPRMEAGGDLYRKRYNLKSALQKLVDNRGNDFEPLYGVRNFRAVLNGVYYRSGANNAYHRKHKRENSNPMPIDGLENLCREGFSRVVYLYSTNYNRAPRNISCQAFKGQNNELAYEQISGLSGRERDIHLLIAEIFEHISSPHLGPILDHCWNGWHASGFVAAVALRQFCRFDATSAVRYWDAGTDGNNKAKAFEKVREMIRRFKPYPEFMLSDEERMKLCPDPVTFEFKR